MIDKWERELQQGLEPDLEEGLPPEEKEKLKQERAQGAKKEAQPDYLEALGVVERRPSRKTHRAETLGEDFDIDESFDFMS